MSEPNGHQLGRYRLIRRLAKGGMAEVFLARSQGAMGFEKTVAIKRILPRFAGDEQFINMMVDEAKITVLLNHPNIAQIIEFGEQDGAYFIVMEYVPGQSLSALNKRLRKRYDEKIGTLEAAYVTVEMLVGLHAAHTQNDRSGKPANIIHRDVSPQNVLLSYDGNVKVIDFGIARATERIERTQVGTIKGKLRYLAPEMIDPGRFGDGGRFDHRVDVFAAGIVLFELVAGRQLFEGENEFDVYKNITDGRIPDLAGEGLCDDGLMRILDRALKKHATDRYASAEDFADDLRAYLYRTDPGFTARRIQTLMEKCFSEEKQALANLEAEDAASLSDGGSEGTSASGRSDVNRTRASRRRSRDPSGTHSSGRQPVAAGPEVTEGKSSPRQGLSALGSELGPVNPSAETQMVASDDIPGYYAAIGGRDGGGDSQTARAPELSGGSDVFDENTADVDPQGNPVSYTDVDETRLSLGDGSARGSSALDDADTPVTSTQQIARKAGVGATRWPLVIAAASVFGVLMAVGGVLLTEVLLKKPPPADGPVTGDGDAKNPEPAADPGQNPGTAVPEGKVALAITARPANATVRLKDGDAPTTLPAEVVTEPGASFLLTFEARGYKTLTKRFTVPDDGARAGVEVELEPIPVEIVIQTIPKGAEVKVDGETHWEGQKVIPGELLVVEATLDGYEPLTEEVTAEAGDDLVLKLKLKKVKAAKPPPDETSPGGDEETVASNPGGDDPPPRSGRRGGQRKPKGSKKPTTGEPRNDKPSSSKEMGTLFVLTGRLWANVTVDGKKLEDTTPVRKKLPPGEYTVVVSHPPKGLVKKFKVTIEAGQTTRKEIQLE